MDALISGHAGVALLLDGSTLASLHTGSDEALIPRQPEDIGLLLAGAADLELLEDVDLQQVTNHLNLSVKKIDALHLALMLLDRDLSDRTRAQAARALEEVLGFEAAKEYLERILYARPLPANADLAGALRLSWAIRTTMFFTNLQSLQDAITSVHSEWEQEERRREKSAEELARAHAAAAQRGVLRDLVLKRQAGHTSSGRAEVAVPDRRLPWVVPFAASTPSTVSSGSGLSIYGHATPQVIGQFLNVSPAPTPMHNLVRHLLAGCRTCSEQLLSLGWNESRLASLLYLHTSEPKDSVESSPPPYNYDQAFSNAERTLNDFFEVDQAASDSPENLLARLADMTEARQISAVRAEQGFQTPHFVRKLLGLSHAARYEDPDRMLHMAWLAQEVAEVCTAETTGNERRLADLRARAWGGFGNALRVAGRLREAGEALARAQSYLEAGTGDPPLRARLLEQVASLRTFERRFEKAIELAAQAEEIYRELGEMHQLASTLIQKAMALLYSGQAETAILSLNKAIPLLDQEEDPHLLLAACHNMVICYIDLDQPEQALEIYSRMRELYKEFKDPLILLRGTWQEGRLLRDLGHLRGAEAALLHARNGFLERGLAYEVAVVSLDLASVHVRLGSLEELRSTLAETMPIFRSLRLGRDALAVLIQLQQAADQEEAALKLISHVYDRLQTLHSAPGYREY